jgi:hypothetical protein
MANYQTYQMVGIKEQVSDVITNLSPRKTPFQNGIGNEKVTQPLFQWQEDSLRAPATNAAVEGADASFITVTPTVMRNNYTQIFTEAVQVSDRADIVSTYGRKREMAYQMAKSSAAIKRDREIALIGNAQVKASGSSSVASTLASFQQQLDSTTVTYSGSGATPLSEALLVTALRRADPHHGHPVELSGPRWLRCGGRSLPHHHWFGQQDHRQHGQPLRQPVRRAKSGNQPLAQGEEHARL